VAARAERRWAAACLLLLFAQPISRIVRLTTEDLIRQDGQLLLRLGEPPAPVPEPFAALLLQLAASRQNMNTAPNPASPWLFPGRRAGQPLHPGTLWTALRHFGIPATAARTALRDLVLQAPAPVIARALRYGHMAIHRHAAQAGTPGPATLPATIDSDLIPAAGMEHATFEYASMPVPDPSFWGTADFSRRAASSRTRANCEGKLLSEKTAHFPG
jgi:hypothetical protein